MIKYIIFLCLCLVNLAHATQLPGVLSTYFYTSQNLSGSMIIQPEGTIAGSNVINNNWAAGAPTAISAYNSGDNFSIRYTGYIKIPYTGYYTFYTNTDDGVRLYLDCNATGNTTMAAATNPSTILINKWVDQSATEWSGSCSTKFKQGEYYKYIYEFYENGGSASATFQWGAGPTIGSTSGYSKKLIVSGNATGTAYGSYYDDAIITPSYQSVTTSCAQPRQVYLNFDLPIMSSSVSVSDFTVSTGAVVTNAYVVPGNTMVILTLDRDLPTGTAFSVSASGLLGNSGTNITSASKSTTYAGGQILQQGILGNYYTQTAGTFGLFTSTTPVTNVDTNINFDWSTSKPSYVSTADYFSVSWTGYIKFPSSNSYVLTSTTDDGGRLYVDPNMVIGSTTSGSVNISSWIDQSATATPGLTFSGFDSNVYVPIRNEMYENGGFASAKLTWKSTDGTLLDTPIPSTNYFYCATPTGIPNGLNATEIGANPVSGHIYTKLAGVPFNLTVSALKDTNSDGISDALEPYFAIKGDRSVKVEVINKSSGSCTTYNQIQNQTVSFTQSNQPTEQGQKTVSISIPNAYTNLGIRLTDVTSGIVSCSSDSFSVRPSLLTLTSSANNTLSTGSPTVKAGSTFTISADASVSLYTGTPVINNAAITAHTGAITTGTLSGSFSSAASGISNGSFTYSDVGNFSINAGGVSDTNWTAVDSSNGDCTADYSNNLLSGKYGCYLANTTASSLIGRFIPDHFDISGITLIPRNDYPTCSGTFNYIGEDIQWGYTITAKNSSGNLTKNYTGPYNKASLTNTANYALRAKSTTPLNTYITSANGSIINGSGSGALVGGLVRSTISNVLTSDWGMLFTDADGVTTTVNTNLDSVAGNDSTLLSSSLSHRFGMLKLGSATGNNNTPIRVPYQIIYRDNNGWRVAVDDTCTTYSNSNVVVGNLNNIANGNITINNVSSLSNGVGYITVRSNITNQASFEIGFQNSNTLAMCPTFVQTNTSSSALKSYLYGNYCSNSFDRDQRARVTLGVSSKNNPIIYWQEKY